LDTKNFTIETIELIEELESKIAPSGMATLDNLPVVIKTGSVQQL